jgi:hypothetical protein
VVEMGYCSTADVRSITNLVSTEITDSEINTIISYATYQLNADIGVTLRLPLTASNFRGSINSSNTVFTFLNVPIGDMDNDGSVGTTDVQMWYKLNTEDHYTEYSNPVSAINDDEIGKVTFATAPAVNTDYIIKYVMFPIPFDSGLIKQACAELSAYMCFLKVNLKDIDSYSLGKMSISKTTRQPDLVNFYDRYKETLGRIRGRLIFRSVSWEMSQQMSSDIEETVY